MTSAEHDAESISRWLADQHHDLHAGLERFLDVGTGLQAAMLYDRHSDLLDAVGSALDAEAGLSAILTPPTAEASQPEPTPDPARHRSGPSGVAAAIAAADPAIRMALRRNPVTLAVIYGDFTVQAVMILEVLDRDRDRHRALTRSHARDLVTALNLELDRAQGLEHAIALVHGRQRSRYRGRRDPHPKLDLDLDLDLVRRRARDLAHELDRDRDRDLNLNRARDLARAVIRARARALDYAGDHTFVLDRARGLAHDLDLKLDRSPWDLTLDGARVLALDFVREVSLAVGRILGVERVEHLVGLAVALVDGALDNFTRADLTHIDLSGHNLTGVRWSVSGTKWPEGTDIAVLKTRSQEIDPDTFVISAPGGPPRIPSKALP